MSINSRNGNTLLDGGFFAPVRAASTAAITLSALQTVDGVALAEGDRVLVKDQSDATTNGIYAAGSGNWVRATDAASNTDFFSGMAVVVALGTVNAGQIYLCSCTDDPVVIGTSSLTFEKQSDVLAAQQSATSTTSLAVGTGTRNFTTQSGKSFTANQWVLAYSVSNPANAILCQIVSYSGTALDTTSIASGGSGTVTDWAIVLTNSAAAAGLQPPVGTGNTTGAASSTAGHLATFADTTGKVLTDGGKAGALANLDTLTAQYLASSAMAYGHVFNATLVESHTGGAATFALKTLAGNDPSSSDPVLVTFRNATSATGNYVPRSITAAASLTISSGSTIGASNGGLFDLCFVLFDDSGTVRLGVVNPVGSDSSIYPVAQLPPIASSTAEGGAGAADSAKVFYTGAAVSAKAYVPLAVARYAGGLTTAGTWDASPTTIQLYGYGVQLPATGRPLLYHVREQQAQNTASSNAPTSGAWRTVVLNTSVTNEISGASLSSNVISLPAGTYRANASMALGINSASHVQLRLRNTSDSATLIVGQSRLRGGSFYTEDAAAVVLFGTFTISATKNVELQIQVDSNMTACTGANFDTECYVDLILTKVA